MRRWMAARYHAACRVNQAAGSGAIRDSPLIVANLLQTDQATVRTVLQSWGPGKFDAQLFLDGKAFRPDGKTAATLLPAAFGLAGVNQVLGLNLTEQAKTDLIEYLKSL
jgi:hypothetical protein